MQHAVICPHINYWFSIFVAGSKCSIARIIHIRMPCIGTAYIKWPRIDNIPQFAGRTTTEFVYHVCTGTAKSSTALINRNATQIGNPFQTTAIDCACNIFIQQYFLCRSQIGIFKRYAIATTPGYDNTGGRYNCVRRK